MTCLGRIAAVKPALRPEILRRLLQIDKAPREEECGRILAGKVLTAVAPLFRDVSSGERRAIRRFAGKHEKSSRPATAKAAARVLKKFDES